MNRVVSLVALIVGAIFFRIVIADPVMQVQLPFYDGKAYRCTQNSNDTPTHQFDSTRYDLDFDMKIGGIVVAAADGVMRWGSNPNGFGTYAKVDHGNGYWTIYGHLSGYIAHDGDIVSAGQPIAYSGNTGNVYPIPTREKPSGGQHIHFGVHDGSGTGTSRSMEVYAFNQNSSNLGWFSTDGQSDFVCRAGTTGNKYESRPIGKIFSDYSCKSLTGGGVLCWRNNPTTCEDGQDHVWYHKDSEGANVSESESDTWRKCFEDSGQVANVFSYLEGGHGIGGPGPGTWTGATDLPIPSLPDFITSKVALSTPLGEEAYRFGYMEKIVIDAYVKNVGDADWAGDRDDMYVTAYLSHGYKVDSHSEWVRVGQEQIKRGNIDVGKTKHERFTVDLPDFSLGPGMYNFVVCADRKYDQDNGDGEVPEKHKSNNCSTEAVFEVAEEGQAADTPITPEPRPAPQLVITKFQDESGCCTTNTGSRIKPNIWVRNDGPASPGANVTVIYHISSPVATGGAYIHIGYGSIEPRELPSGGTDEDYMNGSWSIPKSGAWKNQWHTIRGCLKADGSTPVGDPNTEVCAHYTRYSKK